MLCAVLGCQCVVAQERDEFRDFSAKGDDYKVLKDLKFKTDDVSFLGFEDTEFFHKPYKAAKYSLNTSVLVQVLSALRSDGGEISTYKSELASFDIYVTQDDTQAAHDAIVREMYELWSRKEMYSGQWFYDFSLNGKDYFLVCTPDSVEVKGFYLIWSKGRLIKVSFKKFQNSQDAGWGVMSSFTERSFRIRLNDKEYPAYSYPLRAKKEFLKMFQAGFFNSN